MKKFTLYDRKVILSNPASLHGYFGWPTVTRLKNGDLAAVALFLRGLVHRVLVTEHNGNRTLGGALAFRRIIAFVIELKFFHQNIPPFGYSIKIECDERMKSD